LAEFRRGLLKSIGEECIHTMEEKRKIEKTVGSWVGRNVCVLYISPGLALPGALVRISPSVFLSILGVAT
jgi:hypothetical protein